MEKFRSFDSASFAKRLIETEHLPARRAGELAAQLVQADDDIRGAAEHWARTGTMPSEPVIADYSPSELAEFLDPSEVLTALIGLRSDREQTLWMLQHPGDLRYLAAGLPEPQEEHFPASSTMSESPVAKTEIPTLAEDWMSAWVEERDLVAHASEGSRRFVERAWELVLSNWLLDSFGAVARERLNIRALDLDSYPAPPMIHGRRPDLFATVGNDLVVVAKVQRHPTVDSDTLEELHGFQELGRRRNADVHIMYFVPSLVVSDIEQLVKHDPKSAPDTWHILPSDAHPDRFTRSALTDLFESYLAIGHRRRRLIWRLLKRQADG